MQDSIYYTDFRWPELKKFADRGAIILLPIGQTEEHGPHLPVGCDYLAGAALDHRFLWSLNLLSNHLAAIRL